MITWFKKFIHAFLYDELAFTRWMRGLLLTFGASGMGFADQLATLINAPAWVTSIKVFSAVCFFVGGAITAGEKNPKAEVPDMK